MGPGAVMQTAIPRAASGSVLALRRIDNPRDDRAQRRAERTKSWL